MRLLVTGGAGFLGSFVIDELARAGFHNVAAPRSSEYDLRKPQAIAKLMREVRPKMIIHLAAVVGGIGANRENAGRFFYENLIMGVELMEQARLGGSRKIRRRRHGMRLSQVYSGAVSRRRPLDRLSRRNQTRRMDWPRKCCWCRPRPTVSNTASTRSTCCRSTSTVPMDRPPQPFLEIGGGSEIEFALGARDIQAPSRLTIRFAWIPYYLAAKGGQAHD
jgi:hypothetical protein